jgi:hypothetical protein
VSAVLSGYFYIFFSRSAVSFYYFFSLFFSFQLARTLALPSAPSGVVALRVGVGRGWRQCVVIAFLPFLRVVPGSLCQFTAFLHPCALFRPVFLGSWVVPL